MATELATFGAGCFWGVEEAFREVTGVLGTEVGYSGGRTEDPSYREVCSDTTGHVEVLKIVFDPSTVTYRELLDIFWDIHDPTQLNRQGPDVGTQYRSAIFFHSPGQKEEAVRSKHELEASGRYSRPVVTDIIPAGDFYPAEEYHQKYLMKRGRGQCHI